MKRKTHRNIGMIITIVVGAVIRASPIATVLIGYFLTVAPDYDFALGIKHRGFSHSPLLAAIIGIGVGMLDVKIGILCFVALMSHILLDSLTVMGVPLLYPYSKKMYGLRVFKTHGKMDNWILLVGLGIGILVAGAYGIELTIRFFSRFI